jgi:hypothetical protein
MLKRSNLIVFAFSLVLSLLAVSAEAEQRHLYLCRSPLLAFDFWSSLQNIQKQGVTLTPKIAEQICAGMKAGQEPQCIRVEGDKFKPIATGWAGALALADGQNKVWFHNPVADGWVHPDYYVYYVNSK